MMSKDVWVEANVRNQRPMQLDKKEQLNVWAFSQKVRERKKEKIIWADWNSYMLEEQ